MKQILITILGFAFLACASTPVEDVSKIKTGMLKDEVLDILGTPNRTERFNGKEKWSYRYYTGSEKNIEELYFVTFYEGKVIATGRDTEEAQRIEEIRKDYQQRNERKKNSRTSAAALREKAEQEERQKQTAREEARKRDLIEESTPPEEPNFVDIPGQDLPIKRGEE